jgi:hypothetical protein
VVVFLIPVTLVMHAFWRIPDAQTRALQMGNFLKNAALLGSAFALMAIPVPWPYSLAAGARSPRSATFHRRVGQE